MRNLYYKVRAAIQALTDRELDYNYFSQNLLIAYWQQAGRDELIFNDPRGILYEPHSGRFMQIGTHQVRGYALPSWEYDKILFVEKKGLWPTLEASGLLKRYDMAVIASEGYACEAARVLMAMAAKNCTLFVLHDADPDGYNIARTLAEETRRMPGHTIDVIDLGLTVAQAVAMGLASETFTRKKELPDALSFTAEEKTYFEGVKAVGHKSWVARRVELNAMSAGQLVGLIEAGVVKHVKHKKLLPPIAVLSDEWERQILGLVEDRLTRAIHRQLSLGAVVDRIAETFRRGDIREILLNRFGEKPEQSWREVIADDAEKAVDAAVIEQEAERIIKDLAA